MPVLNLADDIRLGASQVDAVYLGATQVWPGEVDPGPAGADWLVTETGEPLVTESGEQLTIETLWLLSESGELLTTESGIQITTEG